MTDFDLSKCKRNEQGHYLAMTRDGRPVRIVCTDRRGESNLLGLVGAQIDGVEKVMVWDCWGRPNSSPILSENNLINIPPKKVTRTVWINLFDDINGRPRAMQYSTEVYAKNEAHSLRAYVVAHPITWEEEEKA